MSLYRHTATYLVGRGAPALVGLVAVGIYTRLVPPEEFGLFVLALSVVSFGNRTLFQWLRVAVVRFAPKHADPRSALVATAGVAFIALVVLGTAVGAGVWTVLAGHPVGSLVPVGVAGLCALGWFELCLEFLRARGQAVSYAAASVLRAVLTLGLSWFLAVRGHGSQGLLLGVAAGWVVAPLPFIRRIRPRGRTAPPDPRLLRGLFRYGAPLTLAFLLDGVVIASDRLLVGWLRGVDAAGLYGVAADLTMNALLMLMQPVHLAAMPLIVHALEARGERAARDELLDNLRVLLALGLPAAVGLAMLAGNVAHVVLGAEYRVAAVALLPLVAAATLLSGLRAYYVDLSFQLGQRTEMLIRVAARGRDHHGGGQPDPDSTPRRRRCGVERGGDARRGPRAELATLPSRLSAPPTGIRRAQDRRAHVGDDRPAVGAGGGARCGGPGDAGVGPGAWRIWPPCGWPTGPACAARCAAGCVTNTGHMSTAGTPGKGARVASVSWEPCGRRGQPGRERRVSKMSRACW